MKTLFAALLLLSAALPATAQDDRAERERIKADRAVAQARFAEEEQACYRRFAVTDCIAAARQRRNDVLADLRRQELVLNEAERKRRAEQRLRTLDERASPERQREAAERRARALAGRKEREARAADKAASRGARQADGALRARLRQAPAQAASAAAAVPPAGPAVTTPEAERKRQRHAQRVKEAREHKAQVMERLANRRKPPAADLPTPP